MIKNCTIYAEAIVIVILYPYLLQLTTGWYASWLKYNRHLYPNITTALFLFVTSFLLYKYECINIRMHYNLCIHITEGNIYVSQNLKMIY